jgi:hypothetical protein
MDDVRCIAVCIESIVAPFIAPAAHDLPDIVFVVSPARRPALLLEGLLEAVLPRAIAPAAESFDDSDCFERHATSADTAARQAIARGANRDVFINQLQTRRNLGTFR